jgi:uncharacterized protein (TIGR01777 family)
MRVLVTGGTGFVGRALCKRLHEAGNQVTVVSRSPARARQTLDRTAEAISWEDLDVPGLMDGMDAVVHLAGETVTGRWNEAKRRLVMDSRLEGTRRVVNAIKAASQPPEVLVSASGIGFYGEGGEAELSEEAPPGTDYFARLCVDWEREALCAEEAGCRVVVVRLGIVLGLGGGAVGAMLGPARLGLGGPLGSGQQWWSWIHLEDAASGIEHALFTPSLRGPVNLVAPAPIRQRDFARALGVALGRPGIVPAPALALRLMLGTFAEEILGSKRVRPERLMRTDFSYRFGDLTGAFSSLFGPPKHPSPWLPLLGAASLGLAPFSPEPHVLGKLKWVLGGAHGMHAVDWLDLGMHASPWLWLFAVLALRGGALWTARGP